MDAEHAPAAAERWRPNVTVAAFAVDEAGRFLVVEEATPDGLRINNPAGHLEPGESLEDAVRRECLEETGRAFEPDALLGVYLGRAASGVTHLRFAFRGRAGPADPARALDAPIVRARWMSADELRGCRAIHRSPALLAGVADFEAGAAHALALLRVDASVFALPAGPGAPDARGQSAR